MPIAIGQTATNPQTGHRIVLTPQGWTTLGSQQLPVPDTDKAAIEHLQQQVNDSQFLDQKAQQFGHVMGGGPSAVGTGPGYGVVEIPHLAENINPSRKIGEYFEPKLGDLQSITNQAWVHERPTGSGRLMQPEVEGFQQAFPNVQNWGNVNGRIIDRLHQDALIASQKLQFIDGFIRSGHGSYAEANAAWQQQFGNNIGAMGATPQQGGYMPPSGPQTPGPPMQMVPDPNSPIGAVPQPGAQPPQNLTPQQQAILNWTPEKGLHP